MAILHRTGDVDPITHGGGVVKEWGEFGLVWFCWQTADDFEEDETFEVYEVLVPDSITEEYDWIDLEGVAKSIGADPDEFLEAADSEDLVTRVGVLEDIAGHWGAFELTQCDPTTMTKKELLELCEFEGEEAPGRSVRAAHCAQRAIANMFLPFNETITEARRGEVTGTTYIDFQPGNSTRYQLLLTEVKGRLLEGTGYDTNVNYIQVTLLNHGKFRSCFICPRYDFFWVDIARGMDIAEADAAVITWFLANFYDTNGAKGHYPDWAQQNGALSQPQ